MAMLTLEGSPHTGDLLNSSEVGVIHLTARNQPPIPVYSTTMATASEGLRSNESFCIFYSRWIFKDMIAMGVIQSGEI